MLGGVSHVPPATTANVDNNATLVVSYVGYITQEVKVARGKMKIVLVEDSKVLEDVVVVGYSTQAKKDKLADACKPLLS